MVKDLKTLLKHTNMIQLRFSNPEVANYNTYISYDLLNMIGEVGGLVGLTMGASILSLIESLLNYAQQSLS